MIITDVKHPHIQVGKNSTYLPDGNEPFDSCIKYSNPNNQKEEKLIIGDNCRIESGVSFIMSGNQGHRTDWVSTYTFFFSDRFKGGKSGYQTKGDTIIGNNVTIEQNAVIMPGVEIGDGAVIKAGSLVIKDVKPKTIIGGNPARELKEPSKLYIGPLNLGTLERKYAKSSESGKKTPFFGYIINEGFEGKGIQNKNLNVGDFSYYAGIYHNKNFEESLIYERGKECELSVGSYCSIGSGAHFLMSHTSDQPTKIGNDVFIGYESIIMPGVTIGNGAVVATRSLVYKDVPPYSVVIGNPAGVIKKRFDPKTIEALEEIKWWDWPHDVVEKNLDLICAEPDIEKLKAISKSLQNEK